MLTQTNTSIENEFDALIVAAATDTGRRRSSNEDAFRVVDLNTGSIDKDAATHAHSIGCHGALLVVADGVGGTTGGETASRLAVETLHDMLMDLPDDLSAGTRVRIAAEAANECIWRQAQAARNLRGMATTATAALVQGDVATIAQVGDSRAYLFRGGRLRQLTKDQSWAQVLIDTGQVKPEDRGKVAHNVITQALGASETVEPVITSVELKADDSLLLCSDGLWDMVTDEQIRNVMFNSFNPAAACRELITLANQRGGNDNITVVIAHIEEAERTLVPLPMTLELPRLEQYQFAHAAAA
ncbi:MAG: protein phosphatase 2C domain-containing protein [Pyrinomonadaceae bacterium]